MATPLNVLIVEDSPNDAELVLAELRRAGFDPKWKRIETEADFLTEIKKSPDIILSDYSMPLFTGLRAAELLQKSDLSIPFILISGTVGEDVAVEAMKVGATDYLLKDRLIRLGDAVKRALEQKRLRDEHKKTEQTLAAERNLLRILIDLLPDYFYVKDTQFRFLVCNEACARLMGAASSPELIGKTDADFYPPGKVAEFNTDEQAVFEGKPIINKEEPFIHPDGTKELILTTKLPIKDSNGKITGLVGYGRNITASRHAEQSLAVSEERYRQLAEQSSDVFWFVALNPERYEFMSPAVEKIWGRPAEWYYAHPEDCMAAIHPEDVAHFTKAWEACINGQSPRFQVEYRIIRPDGSICWVQDSATPIRNEAGEIFRMSGVAKDITETRKLEEQFRQSQKMEAVGQLASGVAHDFNNILAIIQIQSDLLKAESNLSKPQSELAGEISTSVQRAAALTRQLLLFSRKEKLQPHDIDLSESVGNLTKMLRRLLGEDIQLQLKFATQSLFIHADTSMIDQVLMNLAVNARDAMPKGGELTIETSAIEFNEPTTLPSPRARAGSFVCLSVSDTGSGIPPEVLPRIYEPFFTTKGIGKGTGLGLATVFNIVQQHTGWIDLESEVGRGTTFKIYLPRLSKMTDKKIAQQIPATKQTGHETILLVEDDSALRASLQKTLSQLGYRVLEATDGEEALAIWRRNRDDIRLLLTDLVLPGGISGKDLAIELLKEKPKMKVIYASGYNPEIAGADFPLEEGFNFLTKPFQVQKLAQTVRTQLDELT